MILFGAAVFFFLFSRKYVPAITGESCLNLARYLLDALSL